MPMCLPELFSASNDPQLSSKHEISSASINAVTNSSNISAFCHFKIIESSLKDIVKLMHDSKTNVIKLSVWIKSDNETMHQTLVLKDIQWANKVGRTLYSLMVSNVFRGQFISSLSNRTLSAGHHDVNVIVNVTQKELCISLKHDTFVDLIFAQLIYQFYHISDDDTEYKMCKSHIDDTTKLVKYNCCAIVSKKNELICSDYSSVLKNFYAVLFVAPPLVFVNFFFFFMDYLNRSMKETTHYKISDSPMALSSILHMLLFEGHGPVKSFGRKLFIVICTLLPGFSVENLGYTIALSLWAFIFMCVDTFIIYEDVTNLTLIEIITFPFNLKLWWRVVSKEWPCFYNNLKLTLKKDSTEVTERTRLLSPEIQEHGNGHQANYEFIGQFNGQRSETNIRISQSKRLLKQLGERWKYRLSIYILLFFYLVMSIPLYILALYFTGYIFSKKHFMHQRSKLIKWSLFLWYWVSAIFMLYVAEVVLVVAFLTSTGLFLNGQTYRPYFVPLCTILFYSWINWKSLVEAKYLALNKNIYEVCKNSTPVYIAPDYNVVPEEEETGDGSNSIFDKNISILNNKFVIQVDHDGEPIIPKELYNKVREKFLPYNRVLFDYFFGVIIVAGFAYFLSVLLSLSQTSGVSSNTEVIGSIAATLLPILFNFVWSKGNDEQKEVDTIALKSKLKRVLVVCSSNYVSKEIVVELKIMKSLDMYDILKEFLDSPYT